jgi:hypothetical protein
MLKEEGKWGAFGDLAQNRRTTYRHLSSMEAGVSSVAKNVAAAGETLGNLSDQRS